MNSVSWNPLIGTDWDPLLGQVFSEGDWSLLREFVDRERARFCVHPSREEVFKAFQLTSFGSTRVVILGQDPYHKNGWAHGLAFSVPSDVRVLPRTLQNIRRELKEDLQGNVSIPPHGSLELWARKGVLLLNTVLTVRQGERRSHRRQGWEQFTDRVIKVINEKPNRVVFVLWGEHAQEKGELIDQAKHAILESSHPSPQSELKPKPIPFRGSHPFSKANDALAAAGQENINWDLA